MDKIIPFAHKLLAEVANNGVCIDMTAGNGNDTLMLAELASKVYAFDIQEVAVKNTKEKTIGKDNVVIIKDSHDNVLNYVNEKVNGVIYNLGYLPCGDKSITTNYETTISSLKKVLTMLNVHGRVVIVCYPGCSSGKKESDELDVFLSSLSQKEYSVIVYKFINQINNPPFIYAIEREK